MQSVVGEAAAWGATEHLLAAAVEALQAANWQRGGGKGQRPKPVQRPGAVDKTTTKIGGKKRKRRNIAEMREFLDSRMDGGE